MVVALQNKYAHTSQHNQHNNQSTCLLTKKQVRVYQGRETDAFLRIFNGKFIVHKGNTTDQRNRSLYHVKGTNQDNAHAVQVDEVIN